MKKKKSLLPKFKNIREEAKFWDTHSFADYWDEFKDVDLTVELHRPKEETLIIRVQKNLRQKLEEEARIRGINISTLARIWLLEKLHQSRD